jgi:hypothetical protein
VLAGPPNERSKVDQVEALIATRIATKRRLRVSSLVQDAGSAAAVRLRAALRAVLAGPTNLHPPTENPSSWRTIVTSAAGTSRAHTRRFAIEQARPLTYRPLTVDLRLPGERDDHEQAAFSRSANSPQQFADDLKTAGPH